MGVGIVVPAGFGVITMDGCDKIIAVAVGRSGGAGGVGVGVI